MRSKGKHVLLTVALPLIALAIMATGIAGFVFYSGSLAGSNEVSVGGAYAYIEGGTLDVSSSIASLSDASGITWVIYSDEVTYKKTSFSASLSFDYSAFDTSVESLSNTVISLALYTDEDAAASLAEIVDVSTLNVILSSSTVSSFTASLSAPVDAFTTPYIKFLYADEEVLKGEDINISFNFTLNNLKSDSTDTQLVTTEISSALNVLSSAQFTIAVGFYEKGDIKDEIS